VPVPPSPPPELEVELELELPLLLEPRPPELLLEPAATPELELPLEEAPPEPLLELELPLEPGPPEDPDPPELDPALAPDDPLDEPDPDDPLGEPELPPPLDPAEDPALAPELPPEDMLEGLELVADGPDPQAKTATVNPVPTAIRARTLVTGLFVGELYKAAAVHRCSGRTLRPSILRLPVRVTQASDTVLGVPECVTALPGPRRRRTRAAVPGECAAHHASRSVPRKDPVCVHEERGL
jgi:hypothetical protein